MSALLNFERLAWDSVRGVRRTPGPPAPMALVDEIVSPPGDKAGPGPPDILDIAGATGGDVVVVVLDEDLHHHQGN